MRGANLAVKSCVNNVEGPMGSRKLAILGASLALFAAAPAANAQFGDLSPVLLVESGPSDNPEYRRMVFVRFLSGSRVSVNYKAYNRAEFIQVPNSPSGEAIAACANGAATPLSQIQAFERDEARATRSGKAPEVVRFCIKNVQNWEGGNRDRYLDPIFEGMPHAASLKY